MSIKCILSGGVAGYEAHYVGSRVCASVCCFAIVVPLLASAGSSAAAAVGGGGVRAGGLLRDRRFDRARLWNIGQLPGRMGVILAIFAVAAILIWLGVRRFAPHLEWSLVRQSPGFWAVVMVAYPVLSVYPQGLLYRAFFFERYASLFPGKWAMVVASLLVQRNCIAHT